jgi:F-type H+-transporting ATPase subunit b
MLKLDWNIIGVFVNVIVLYWLMQRFLFKPVTDIMDKRTNTIANSFEDADNKNKEALQLKNEYQEILGTADDKADTIIKEAKQRALEVHEKQVKETKEETARMIEEANKLIELERKKSMQGIQSEIANIAMIAAAKVLQKNVDDNTNKQLVEDFLSEAGAGK